MATPADDPPTEPIFPGFSSPTYTIVPDELFDDLLADLSGAELKVLLYIIRRTFGFKKDSDNISLKQLAEGIVTKDGRVLDRGAGVGKSAAALAVKTLAEKGYIVTRRNRSHEKGDEPTTYGLRFRDTPVSRKWTRGCPENGQARVHFLDTQETVEQDTVSSNIQSHQPSSFSGGPSKFRKGSRPDFEGTASLKPTPEPSSEPQVNGIRRRVLAPPEKPIPASEIADLTDDVSERGMARIGHVLATLGIAPQRAREVRRRASVSEPTPQPSEAATGDPIPQEQQTHRAQPRVPKAEQQVIRTYLTQYAEEFHDQAPKFTSTMTRVLRLYLASGLLLSPFTARMEAARRRTKADQAAGRIRNKTSPFPYFVALLEEELGLREPPQPVKAQAADQARTDAEATPRKSLAGRYSHLVRH